MTKHEKLEHAIDRQVKWIESHGGDLAGYRERYGDPELSFCHGEGGTVIYRADLAELRRLRDQRSSTGKSAKTASRRIRERILRDLGLVKVRGALGGTYWE